jgi:hypothetical protein
MRGAGPICGSFNQDPRLLSAGPAHFQGVSRSSLPFQLSVGAQKIKIKKNSLKMKTIKKKEIDSA